MKCSWKDCTALAVKNSKYCSLCKGKARRIWMSKNRTFEVREVRQIALPAMPLTKLPTPTVSSVRVSGAEVGIGDLELPEGFPKWEE